MKRCGSRIRAHANVLSGARICAGASSEYASAATKLAPGARVSPQAAANTATGAAQYTIADTVCTAIRCETPRIPAIAAASIGMSGAEVNSTGDPKSQ